MRYQINKKLGLQRRYKTCLGARITFWNSFVVLLVDYGDDKGDRGNSTH